MSRERKKVPRREGNMEVKSNEQMDRNETNFNFCIKASKKPFKKKRTLTL